MSLKFTILFAVIIVTEICNLEAALNSTNIDEKNALRIVNGYPVAIGDIPYQVSFKKAVRKGRKMNSFCGGTIIGVRKVLSAAHCFSSDASNICGKLFKSNIMQSLRGIWAVAGHLYNQDSAPSLFFKKQNGQWRKLKNVTYPKTYRFPKDDIAILFVATPWKFDNFVSSVNPASQLIDYRGQCLASGFGKTSPNSQGSPRLLAAKLEMITQSNCSLLHRRNMNKYICTSSSFTDIGKGDSGGPLVCSNTGDINERNSRVLVGVVSGKRGKDSFFVRVSSYYPYILRNSSISNFKYIFNSYSILSLTFYVFLYILC